MRSGPVGKHKFGGGRRQVGWRSASVLMAAILVVSASPGPARAADPLPTWPTNPDWQSYVPGSVKRRRQGRSRSRAPTATSPIPRRSSAAAARPR